MTIEQVVQRVKANDPEADTDLIVKAYNFALKAHGEQKRKTGEPYIQHPLHTAFILAQMKADLPTILAGLLHDVPEDTAVSAEEVKQTFGEEVAAMVEGITKLRKIRYHGVERYRESLKKMFLAMSTDIRVIFVKFADRLHNLQTLDAVDPKKRIRIAKETLEIYAPIAGLLGIWRLKWQMEDICFKYLYPEEYQKLEYKYEIEKKVELTQYIQKIKNTLTHELDQAGIKHRIEGRFKHLFSIWQKMEAKDRQFDEIYDVFALRIIVNNVADCYNALGVIHNLWRPNYSRFKDYIAVPKPNGYRSLHTTVFGLNGKATEFQIRTEEMHQESLYGLSAHLYYKQNTSPPNEKPMRWMQEVLEVQKEIKDTGEFIKQVKLNVFQDRIFVFTPKGDVYDLPNNATPVDFAYAVHTDIGNKCTQALINGNIAELNQVLKNGDMVEIIIDKKRKGPNSDWLKFVKTRKARNRIKQYSKKFRLSDIKKIIPGLK
jgi:GTP diphosphokinase / guanosine-3',5'-bis(diphosphate) 3'-diphosphatase